MVRYSTRAMRYLWRQLSTDCLLYTEMHTASALLKGNHAQLLDYSPDEKPLALQLADNSPRRLKICARIGEDYGYDEINFNVGCPSKSATQGGFGACLIKEPEWVAECVATMAQATHLPITVKTRLGVDDTDSFERLHFFTAQLAAVKTAKLIIHARTALLKGLSPNKNLSIPPLKHDWAYQIKQSFPQLAIILNGGIRSLAAIEYALERTDGVMIGRVAYQNPMFIRQIARFIYGKHSTMTRKELLERMLNYARQRYQDSGESFHHTGKHLLHLYQGMPGARHYRREMTLRLQNPQPPSLSQVKNFLPADSSADFIQYPRVHGFMNHAPIRI